MSLLEVTGLQKIYKGRRGGASVEALKNVNFTVEKGEYVAIMGESGSGKTTLLNILAALDKATAGTVILDGMNLSTIKDSAIASEMKKIYACRYYYDENGIAQWPAQIVNYTTKTQYIFRINKQVLDESNDSDLNTWVPMEQRPIPFSRMIYIADGLTDVPCMKLVKANGGKAVAVYNTNSAAAGFAAEKLIRENRADFIAPADYTEGEKIDTLVKRMIDEMSAAAALEPENG